MSDRSIGGRNKGLTFNKRMKINQYACVWVSVLNNLFSITNKAIMVFGWGKKKWHRMISILLSSNDHCWGSCNADHYHGPDPKFFFCHPYPGKLLGLLLVDISAQRLQGWVRCGRGASCLCPVALPYICIATSRSQANLWQRRASKGKEEAQIWAWVLERHQPLTGLPQWAQEAAKGLLQRVSPALQAWRDVQEDT